MIDRINLREHSNRVGLRKSNNKYLQTKCTNMSLSENSFSKKNSAQVSFSGGFLTERIIGKIKDCLVRAWHGPNERIQRLTIQHVKDADKEIAKNTDKAFKKAHRHLKKALYFSDHILKNQNHRSLMPLMDKLIDVNTKLLDNTMGMQKKYLDRIIKYSNRKIEIFSHNLDLGPDKMAKNQRQLSYLYMRNNDLYKAESLFNSTLHTYKGLCKGMIKNEDNFLGSLHEELGDLQRKIAEKYGHYIDHIRQYKNALELYGKDLAKQEELFGKDSINLCRVWKNADNIEGEQGSLVKLRNIHVKLENWHEAAVISKRITKILKNALKNETNPELADKLKYYITHEAKFTQKFSHLPQEKHLAY